MKAGTGIGVIGRLVGGGLALAAVLCVVFVDFRKEPAEPPEIVRPLKIHRLAGSGSTLERRFPGRIEPSRRATMSFEVPGRLVDLPIRKGDPVKAGQVLAKLDDANYRNDLEAATARLKNAEAQLSRMQEAAKTNAVSKQEVDAAEAARDVARAEVGIKTKAVADTVIKADFDGTIANTFVDNYENVQPKQPVMELQDHARFDITVNIPEDLVPRAKKLVGERVFVVVFDYLPGEEFSATVKEYAAEADPSTQTYAVTFSMVVPPESDIRILPGMTATVVVRFKPTPGAEVTQFEIPADMLAVDGQGKYHVWVVEGAAGERASVTRRDVEVASPEGDLLTVTAGLSSSDVIAAAGVSVLREGQAVRPIESLPEGGE